MKKRLLKGGFVAAIVALVCLLIAGVFQLGGWYAKWDSVNQVIRDRSTIQSQAAVIARQRQQIQSLKATVAEQRSDLKSLRQIKSGEMTRQLWRLIRPAAHMALAALSCSLVLFFFWAYAKRYGHSSAPKMPREEASA